LVQAFNVASHRKSPALLSRKMARIDTTLTEASQMGDTTHMIESQSLSEVPQSPQKCNSGNLGDMLTAMVEQSGQLASEEPALPDSPIKRLHQEYNHLQAKQLQSYVSPPTSPSHGTPSTSNAGRREDICLKDLVEREIKAAQDLEQRRSQSIEPGSQYRSQSLYALQISPTEPLQRRVSEPATKPGHSQSQQDPVDAVMTDPAVSRMSDRPKAAGPINQDQVNALLTDSALRQLNELVNQEQVNQWEQSTLDPGCSQPGASSQCDRVDTLSKQVNHLQKELEKMEETLQQSTESELVALQELEKMEGQKAACAETHAREIAALENTLTSITSENKALKEALAVAMGRNPQKLTPSGVLAGNPRLSGVPDNVERLMISAERVMFSTFVHSGISNLSVTSHSSGSATTEAPCSEPEEGARTPPPTRTPPLVPRMGGCMALWP